MAQRGPGAATLGAARFRSWLWRGHTLRHAEKVFRNCPSPCVLEREFFGYRLSVDVSRSNMQRLLFLEGRRFVAERHLLCSLIRPGMAVADVGANIGYFALMFRRWVGDGGEIHCFEPEPDNLEELRRNVDRNRLAGIAVLPFALGEQDGSLSMTRGINASATAESADRVLVSVRRLDSVPLEHLDLIKIDVEGYEAQVLAGARETLRRFRPDLFVEVHPFLMPGDNECAALLQRLLDYDPRMEIYRIRSSQSGIRRLAYRYGAAAGIERVRNLEGFLRTASALRNTFWCVCRGPREVLSR